MNFKQLCLRYYLAVEAHLNASTTASRSYLLFFPDNDVDLVASVVSEVGYGPKAFAYVIIYLVTFCESLVSSLARQKVFNVHVHQNSCRPTKKQAYQKCDNKHGVPQNKVLASITNTQVIHRT